MVIALFCILMENYKSGFYFHKEIENNKIIIYLSEHVSFLNKANILQTLDNIPDHSEVIIDASDSRYIDYDVYEIINNFKSESAQKQIKLKIVNLNGFGNLNPVGKPQLITANSPLCSTDAGNHRERSEAG